MSKYAFFFCIYSLVVFNKLNSQEMPTNLEEKLSGKIESIQCEIRDYLDSYFFDDVHKILNDSLRPAYINSYENDKRGKYCQIIIGLQLYIESSDSTYHDSLMETVRGFWKPFNRELTRTLSSNIEIDYVKFFKEEDIRYKVAQFFSLTERGEKKKFIYSGRVLLGLFQHVENLVIKPILILYQWKLLEENRFHISDTDTFDLEEQVISLKEQTEKILIPNGLRSINIEDSLLAVNFYAVIDKFLVNKDQLKSINFDQDIIESLTDSINKHLQLAPNNNQYFRPTINHLLNQFFKNYLAQPNVVRFNGKFNNFSQQTSDKKEGFKFSYYFKDGVKKNGNYEVKPQYKKLEEYKNLPIDVKRLFDSNEINAEQLIGNFYHSLCIKNGTILNLAIIHESSLSDLIYAVKIFDDFGMWYDIIEFFSRYATTLTIQDAYTLDEAWYEKSFRISRLDSQEQYARGRKDIARRIMNIWQDRYTWVNYYLRKDPETNNLDVKFYGCSSENNTGFQEIITFQHLNQKSNFMVKFSMNQHWYNFHRFKNEITYASVDIVDFYLNIFNIKAAKSSLSGKLKIRPDDYFGIMIYLKQLFKDDNRLLEIKNKYKDHSEIRKLIRLNEPNISEIPDFIRKNFDEDYLSSNEKNELLSFFESEDYERLHLEYNVFHQAYIQIMGTRTRPSEPREFWLLDKFFH